VNFWHRLWSKNPKDIFLKFSPEGAEFISVSWNFDLKDSRERQWLVELHKKHKDTIQWKKNKGEELSLFQDEKLKNFSRIKSDRVETAALMNIALHSAIKEGLEKEKEFMLTPVSGATAMDFQNETRALQWIQASFGTLTRVLDKMQNDPSLILTAAFFYGVKTEKSERVVGQIAMNLDVLYYLREDQSLQVIVFDDKNMGHGKSTAPTYQQIIKVTKPQFYDEIVKLTNQLARVGEIK
jgi:hypothetical protein